MSKFTLGSGTAKPPRGRKPRPHPVPIMPATKRLKVLDKAIGTGPEFTDIYVILREVEWLVAEVKTYRDALTEIKEMASPLYGTATLISLDAIEKCAGKALEDRNLVSHLKKQA